MILRKANNTDLRTMARIMMEEFSQEPYNEAWTMQTSLKKVNLYFEDKVILVAEEKDAIYGFIIYGTFFWHDGIQGWIDELIVTKEHQGKSIGKNLLHHAEIDLKSKKVKRIWLMSHADSKASSFYDKLDYKQTKFVIRQKEL